MIKDADKQREHWRKWHRNHPSESRANRLRQKTKNRNFLDNLKRDKPCADCGQVFPPCAMDFDHVRGKKIGSIGSLVGSRLKLIAELEKCELVCACCHRVRTRNRELAER